MKKKYIIFIAVMVLGFLYVGGKYNQITASDEGVNAQWSEVLNQYQRRNDLIPNLTAVVKGYASQEKEIFTEIANARSKIGSTNFNLQAPEDAAVMRNYQQQQSELSSALSRLLVITEKYPDLKSDTVFMSLIVQLEGTENRIAVARNRYVREVKNYNVTIRAFPAVFIARIAGFSRKMNFQPDNVKKVSSAPVVDFSH